mmetsp:Transcript_18138/g.46432  ORF Transcript_18138/g.46432 Transcript_18138/m.46432 type:complete len:289 (+) Transcript_18138:569-1435(+)
MMRRAPRKSQRIPTPRHPPRKKRKRRKRNRRWRSQRKRRRKKRRMTTKRRTTKELRAKRRTKTRNRLPPRPPTLRRPRHQRMRRPRRPASRLASRLREKSNLKLVRPRHHPALRRKYRPRSSARVAETLDLDHPPVPKPGKRRRSRPSFPKELRMRARRRPNLPHQLRRPEMRRRLLLALPQLPNPPLRRKKSQLGRRASSACRHWIFRSLQLSGPPSRWTRKSGLQTGSGMSTSDNGRMHPRSHRRSVRVPTTMCGACSTQGLDSSLWVMRSTEWGFTTGSRRPDLE